MSLFRRRHNQSATVQAKDSTELLAEIWLWAVAVRAVVGCGERRLEWMHRIECGWSGQRLRVQRAGWGHTLACEGYKALVLWYG